MRTTSCLALRRAVLPGPNQRIKQAALARELKVSGPSVSGWVHGHTRPEPQYRIALEKIMQRLGIDDCTVDGWFTAEERAMARKDFSSVDLKTGS